MRSGIAAGLVVIAALVGFGLILVNNVQQETAEFRPVVPTEPVASEPTRAWQDILRIGVEGAGTPVPTVALLELPTPHLHLPVIGAEAPRRGRPCIPREGFAPELIRFAYPRGVAAAAAGGRLSRPAA